MQLFRSIGVGVASVVQWLVFAAWSFFWMTGAILYGWLTPGNPNGPLSWARRFWGPGCAAIARARLVLHPGFEPEPGKPYIFMMNHQSMFDIVAAFVLIKINLRFIAKRILKSVPFLGWYMSVTGMVFIDRKDRKSAVGSLDEACRKIREHGISILVYPEGTRSATGEILPLKKGPFVMAIQAGVPIVPVAVEGSGYVLGRDSGRLRPGTVHLKVGEPIETAGLTMADRDVLMRRVRDRLIDLHLEIGGKGGDRTKAISLEGREGISSYSLPTV